MLAGVSLSLSFDLMHRPCTPAVVSGGMCTYYLNYLHALGIDPLTSLPPPLCVNARHHLVSHIHSLLLDPLFIALVVIKCAMCTSIQVVCTPKPPLVCPAKLPEPPMLAIPPLALHTATMLFAAPFLI